jgi:tRNA(fMet)-specific endonuclease VapC
MILLDTDHLTVFRHREYSLYAVLMKRLAASPETEVMVCDASLEEQLRSWLAEIHRRSRDVLRQVEIYQRLTELVEDYQAWRMLHFDVQSANIFKALRAQKVRIGTQDLKIAAIAPANDALLLSANLRDFQQVPNLRVEDWLYTDPR